MILKYVEDPNTASYSWRYDGGCFADNEVAHYSTAELDNVYTFDNVPVEVHQSASDILDRESLSAGGGISVSRIMTAISTLCLVAALAVACLLVFTLW